MGRGVGPVGNLGERRQAAIKVGGFYSYMRMRMRTAMIINVIFMMMMMMVIMFMITKQLQWQLLSTQPQPAVIE